MSIKQKKAKEPITPIQGAMAKIKTAYITAFFSAAITLVATILSIVNEPVFGLDAFALIDVVVIIVLAVLLMKLKSRVVSVILLAFYVANQILIRMDNPGMSSSFTAFFIIMYLNGIWGTFLYHKVKKQENEKEIKENVDIQSMMPTAAIRAQSPKGRVLLSHTFDGLEIVVKRTFGLTELVVDGLVYAEKKGVIETSYAMEAYVGNALIKVTMDISANIFLYVNGSLLEQKHRII